jgi:hypothetical protein
MAHPAIGAENRNSGHVYFRQGLKKWAHPAPTMESFTAGFH